MSDGWASVANLLGLRQQRRQANRDRITGGLQNLASMIYGTKNREDEQAHDITLADRATAAASDAAYKGHQYGLELEGVQQEGRAALGEQGIQGTIRIENARTRNAQVLQDDTQAFEERMRNMDNRSDLEQLREQIAATRDNLEAQLDQPHVVWPAEEWLDFPDPETGETVQINSDYGFELFSLRTREKLIADRIALEKAGDDVPDNQQAREAYSWAKELTLTPAVYNSETGTWQSMADINPTELEQLFLNNLLLADSSLSQQQIDAAVRSFSGFIERIPEAPPGGADGGVEPEDRPPRTPYDPRTDPGFGVIDALTRAVRTTDFGEVDPSITGTDIVGAVSGGGGLGGFGSGLSYGIMKALQGREAPAEPTDPRAAYDTGRGDYPAGISTSEQQVYDLLMDFAGRAQGEQKQQYEQLIRNLVENDVAPPGGDPMSFIRQMLSGVQ